MSYTPENIYNFSAYAQCKLAIIGKSLANKLVYKDLCIQDKLAFVLANTYKNIIQNYNSDSCINEDTLCAMITYLRKYLNETSYYNNNCNC